MTSRAMTTTTYDPDADIFGVTFADARILESEEIAPGLVVDYDEAHRIVGIEVSHARTRITPAALFAARSPLDA